MAIFNLFLQKDCFWHKARFTGIFVKHTDVLKVNDSQKMWHGSRYIINLVVKSGTLTTVFSTFELISYTLCHDETS